MKEYTQARSVHSSYDADICRVNECRGRSLVAGYSGKWHRELGHVGIVKLIQLARVHSSDVHVFNRSNDSEYCCTERTH